MAGVAVSLVGPSFSGGGGGDTFTDLITFADAAAAVAGVSNGFIVFLNPLDVGQTTSLGKKRAVSVTAIREITSL